VLTWDQNFNETLKQWSGVFGYTYGSPAQTLAQTPSSAYTKYVYGSNLVGIYGTGIGHTVPVMGDLDMAWFGISGSTTTTSSSTTTQPTSTTSVVSTKTSTTTSATTTSTSTCTAAHWAQCGGSGFAGCTVCATGYTCTYSNAWYSQCL
jgi:acetylxylan esterase